MTRRSRRRDRGLQLERWSERALDAIDEGILAVDSGGVVTFANAAASELLGWETDLLLGADLHEVIHHSRPDGSPYPRAESPALDCARRGTTHLASRDVVWRRDSTPLTVELTCRPIREGDFVVGAVITLRQAAILRGDDYYGEVLRLTERERAQREVVHQLQEAVRPPQPSVEGVELGVHYLSAEPTEPTGGDLYDWHLLPDGDLHVVVVDVIGKGVGATKDALAVVHAMRVLVLEGCPMEELIARADHLLVDSNPNLVATLLVARYTPSTGRLLLAGGGHPPLLLVTPDGDVREIAAPGIPIGWPDAGTFEVTEVTLERSETAVLYTDGLVEARRDIIAGFADLKQAAAETATYPARHLPRVLIERALAGAQRRDDSLALVLRRRSAPTGSPGRKLLGQFEHRFSPSMAAVPVARHLFAEWLELQSLRDADAADLLVVVSELCTNAVRMASGAPRGVVLRAVPEGDSLVVEVEDDGPGFSLAVPGVDEMPTVEQPAGRGLFIVQSLVDDLTVVPGERGTLVRCRKSCVFPEPDALETSSE